MAVKIRLRRAKSAKGRYNYRIVVADAREARDGRFIEEIGYYNPSTIPATCRLNMEKVDQWLRQGAIPTETVASLIKKARKKK